MLYFQLFSYFSFSFHRNLIGDVHTKTGAIYNKQTQGGAQPSLGGGGADVLSHEMKDTLKTLRSDMSTLLQRPQVRDVMWNLTLGSMPKFSV